MFFVAARTDAYNGMIVGEHSQVYEAYAFRVMPDALCLMPHAFTATSHACLIHLRVFADNHASRAMPYAFTATSHALRHEA